MWWNQYVGTPFVAHGRTVDGCDCWGLVRIVMMKHFGVCLPEYLGYSDPHHRQEVGGIIADHKGEFRKLGQGEERTGDLVLIRIAGIPCHIGVVTEKGRMLHVMTGIDATVESYREQPWKNRMEGIYRYEPRS